MNSIARFAAWTFRAAALAALFAAGAVVAGAAFIRYEAAPDRDFAAEDRAFAAGMLAALAPVTPPRR